MAKTYEPIATTTVSNGTTNSVEFTSISGNYTDLIIVASAKYSSAGYVIEMTFNSDTGTNYSYTRITGDGTSAASTRFTSQSKAFGGWTGASAFAANVVQIMNYSNSTTYKTALTRANPVDDRVAAYVSLWRSTSAITSIKLTLEGGATNYYTSGSSFTLYGIKAA